MTANTISAIIVCGIVLGSVYALMASELSLVWTTLGIFNFAHGALMTLGAYVAWTISDAAGLGFGLATGIAVAAVALIGVGVLVERTVVRPFYDYRDILLITVMTTLATMIFIEKGIQLLWRARLKQLAPIFAALGLTFISEGLANVNGLAEGRFMLVAAAMVLVLLFLPKGLASVFSRR